jgi:D-3-phosphoglycerate dehydrogenase
LADNVAIHLGRSVKVLFTEPEAYVDAVRACIPSAWDCTFRSFESGDRLLAWVAENPCDVVFGRLGISFGASFFAACRGLKVLATPTTGLDHIDLPAAAAARVRVLSLRGERALLSRVTSTAEHAWGLLLACNRRLVELVPRASAGRWGRDDLELHQLAGTTLGIIGLGRLGRMVAQYGRAFQMRVFANDPLVATADFAPGVTPVSLAQLMSESDHIIVTASYSVGDPPIVGPDQILAMKPGVTFVNVARGELADEAALLKGLDSGLIRAIGVDVLAGDSRWGAAERVTSPLLDRALTCPNVLVTPHVGGYAREAIDVTRQFMIERVKAVIEKE